MLEVGLCHYVLRIPTDQELAVGITNHNDMGPYRSIHCYDYYRWLAKMTYCYNGCNKKGSLTIFDDFLDLEEFAHLDNEYFGIFNVAEFLNDDGDDNTSEIYLPNIEASLFKSKINLRKDSNDIQKLQQVCVLCQFYLAEISKNDDKIIGTYVRSKMCILDEKIKVTAIKLSN